MKKQVFGAALGMILLLGIYTLWPVIRRAVIQSPFDDLAFDRKVWLTSDKNSVDCPRGKMVDDLTAKYLWKGKGKVEIEQLLGKPDQVDDPGNFGKGALPGIKSVWSYRIGNWTGFRMDGDYLGIAWDSDGKLVRSWVWQS